MGARGARKSFSLQGNASPPYSPLRGHHCATNSFGATRSHSPVPSPSAGLLWLAKAQLNSSTFFTYPQTTIRYYYAALPFALPPLLLQPSWSLAAPLQEVCRKRDNRRPTPSRLGAFCVLRSFSAPGTNTAREPAPCRHTRIHAYSRAVSVHILAHRPLLPHELPESLSLASDRRFLPTRAGEGREERRAGPTAARLPAPVEAARVGRGAEPEFRKRRGWLSSMKSYS